MKRRRTLSEVFAIFVLLTIIAVVLVSPAFSSGCDADENCLDGLADYQGGVQPFENLLVSANDCPTSFEERVILLINVERANRGFPSLLLDIRLQDAARWFADDIAFNGIQIIPHNDSRGRSAEYRVRDERGYDFDWLGETIIVGSGIDNGANTPEEVIAGWMNSPGHRDILLSPSVEHLGVGYVHQEGQVWDDVTVADFASPLEPGETRQPPFSYCDPGFYRMQFPIVLK